MGSGIVMCLANAGVPTILVETSQEKVDHSMKHIEKVYKASSAYKSGKQTDADIAKVMSNITPKSDSDLACLSNVDIVIEAVFENLETKQEIFRKLDKVCKPNAVLATNTSYLDIDQIGSVASRHGNVVGTRKLARRSLLGLHRLWNLYSAANQLISSSCC